MIPNRLKHIKTKLSYYYLNNYIGVFIPSLEERSSKLYYTCTKQLFNLQLQV